MSEGLQGFEDAPEPVQKAFWERLRKRTDWEHELELFRHEVADPEAPAPVELRHREPPKAVWNETWRKKAERQRRLAQPGREREIAFEAHKQRLLEIPAADYVEALAEVEVGRGKVACPLHSERTPSFSVKETIWHCFGCGEGGNIYNLAGALWGLPLSGRQFMEIHERLLEIYP